jgi:hypothetical protein
MVGETEFGFYNRLSFLTLVDSLSKKIRILIEK